jgi:SAM-dependent methyltransferase
VRPERYKEILKALYTRSRPYHDLIGQAEEGGTTYDDLLTEILQWIRDEGRVRIRLVDVAFGTGHYMRVARGFGAFACGGDLSPYACRKAKGTEPEIPVFQSDAESLPLKDGFFDVAICLQVLEHTPFPERIVAEIARVLRPGGYLFLAAPNMLGGSGFSRTLRAARGMFSGEFKRLRPLPEGIVEKWEAAGSAADIADMDACNMTNVYQAFRLLRSNGMEVVRFDTLRHPKKYRPARLAMARLRDRIPLLRTIGVNFKIIARKR